LWSNTKRLHISRPVIWDPCPRLIRGDDAATGLSVNFQVGERAARHSLLGIGQATRYRLTTGPNHQTQRPAARSEAPRERGSSRGAPGDAKDGWYRRRKMAGLISSGESPPRPGRSGAPPGPARV